MNPSLIFIFALSAFALGAFGAVLAAVEAAYFVTSRAELDQYRQNKNRYKKSLVSIINDYDAHMAAVGFMKVFFEGLAAVFLTLALANIFKTSWAILLTAGAIVLILSLFATATGPKAYGEAHPALVIGGTARIVRFVRLVTGPLATALCRLSNVSSRGVTEADDRDKSEQLLSIVDRAAERDLLEEEEQDIIHSVVEFGDTRVSEVMVPRTDMVTIDSRATIRDAFEEILRTRLSRVPVISGDSDDVVGVIYLRDLAGYIYRRSEESANQTVTRLMKSPQFVPELQRADDLLRKMQREANHLALVVDEYGGIAGLVTLEDLIEELIGEISDEHDREPDEVTELEPGSYLVSARLEIEDLGDLFGVNLEDDETNTVAGLLAKHLGRLPETGDRVVVSGIELEVAEYERKRRKLKTLTATWVGDLGVNSDE